VAAADRAPSTSSVSARIAPLPCFAPVKDPEHQNGAAIVRVLKGVRGPEDLEQEFAVFLAASYGSSQLRVSAEDVSPPDKSVRDARRKVGQPLVEKCSKSVDVGQSVERPLDLYWPDHGRNSGAE
jgi:hypothetical protein